MDSGLKPGCASESTGKLLKCRLLGPPQMTTPERQSLENLFFFFSSPLLCLMQTGLENFETWSSEP